MSGKRVLSLVKSAGAGSNQPPPNEPDPIVAALQALTDDAKKDPLVAIGIVRINRNHDFDFEYSNYGDLATLALLSFLTKQLAQLIENNIAIVDDSP